MYNSEKYFYTLYNKIKCFILQLQFANKEIYFEVLIFTNIKNMVLKTSFIVINSKYREISSTSTSDFTYSLGEVLQVKAIAIKTISIPNVVYNVNVNNNILKLEYDGNPGIFPGQITVPPGQYTIVSLIAAIEPLLSTAIVGTVTIAQLPLISKLQITSSKPVSFIAGTDSPFARVLGITKTTAFSLDTIAQGVFQLQGIDNFFVISQDLADGANAILTNGQKRGIVIDVPNTVNYGETNYYQNKEYRVNQKIYDGRALNLQYINIKIVDSDLNVVDLQGMDIELILLIYESEESMPV